MGLLVPAGGGTHPPSVVETALDVVCAGHVRSSGDRARSPRGRQARGCGGSERYLTGIDAEITAPVVVSVGHGCPSRTDRLVASVLDHVRNLRLRTSESARRARRGPGGREFHRRAMAVINAPRAEQRTDASFRSLRSPDRAWDWVTLVLSALVGLCVVVGDVDVTSVAAEGVGSVIVDDDATRRDASELALPSPDADSPPPPSELPEHVSTVMSQVRRDGTERGDGGFSLVHGAHPRRGPPEG